MSRNDDWKIMELLSNQLFSHLNEEKESNQPVLMKIFYAGNCTTSKDWPLIWIWNECFWEIPPVGPTTLYNCWSYLHKLFEQHLGAPDHAWQQDFMQAWMNDLLRQSPIKGKKVGAVVSVCVVPWCSGYQYCTTAFNKAWPVLAQACSAQVRILLAACLRFAMVRISNNGPGWK